MQVLKTPEWIKSLPSPNGQTERLEDIKSTISGRIRSRMANKYARHDAKRSAIRAATKDTFRPHIQAPCTSDGDKEFNFIGSMNFENTVTVPGWGGFGGTREILLHDTIEEPDSFDLISDLQRDDRTLLADDLVRDFVARMKYHVGKHLDKGLPEISSDALWQISTLLGGGHFSRAAVFSNTDSKPVAELISKLYSNAFFGRSLEAVRARIIAGITDPVT